MPVFNTLKGDWKPLVGLNVIIAISDSELPEFCYV